MQYKIQEDFLVIHDGKSFSGTKVKELDLREGITLFLLGLNAEGDAFFEDSWQINREYESLEFILETRCVKF